VARQSADEEEAFATNSPLSKPLSADKMKVYRNSIIKQPHHVARNWFALSNLMFGCATLV
jgi:hypothetical protein